MLNINDELDKNYMGGGFGWHPFIAGYFVTAGAMDAMKSYKLSQAYINLVEMHVNAHAESLSVAKIVVAENKISILLNYIYGGEEKVARKVVPTTISKDLQLTLYVGVDDIICLPCED